MKFYEKMQKQAFNLLERFGQRVEFSRRSDDIFEPISGTLTQGLLVSFEGQGILKDYGSQYIDGELIQQGDKELMVAAEGLNMPLLTDTVTADGITYQIVNIKGTSPAGLPLVYTLQVRP